jgi:hypothetical protein
MVARVYGDQIVLKLPVGRVTALLRTPHLNSLIHAQVALDISRSLLIPAFTPPNAIQGRLRRRLAEQMPSWLVALFVPKAGLIR